MGGSTNGANSSRTNRVSADKTYGEEYYVAIKKWGKKI